VLRVNVPQIASVLFDRNVEMNRMHEGKNEKDSRYFSTHLLDNAIFFCGILQSQCYENKQLE